MDDDHPDERQESPEVEAARELLRRLIAARRIPMGELDDRLGHAKGYVSRLMQRKIRLTYDLILSILKAIDVDPNIYFTTLHPPPRRATVPSGIRVPAPGGPTPSPRRSDLAELRALFLAQLRHALPELEEAPALADDDLEARILTTVQALLVEDLPRPSRD